MRMHKMEGVRLCDCKCFCAEGDAMGCRRTGVVDEVADLVGGGDVAALVAGSGAKAGRDEERLELVGHVDAAHHGGVHQRHRCVRHLKCNPRSTASAGEFDQVK